MKVSEKQLFPCSLSHYLVNWNRPGDTQVVGFDKKSLPEKNSVILLGTQNFWGFSQMGHSRKHALMQTSHMEEIAS